jgi:hypothetical protein
MFIHMATWGDTTLFDLGARSLLRRGSCYRDVFLHGPPGMVWVQLGVRSLVGWSSVALRSGDLVVLSASIWLALRASEIGRQSRAASVWLAAALFLCYSTSTEWAHCQPDSWMLMPALAALNLLQHQVVGLCGPGERRGAIAIAGLVEGGLWGVAFLIKPFVAVPAVCCLLLALALVVRTAGWRRAFQGVASVLAGGTLALGAAVGVLCLTGDWSEFVASVFGGWNRDYVRLSADWGHRTIQAVTMWPSPWHWIHALAVPVAFYRIARTTFGGTPPIAAAPVRAGAALFAAFYLGWFFQANYLQLLFEYQALPALLLAWCVVVGELYSVAPRVIVAAILPAMVLALVVRHPLLRADRRALWAECWRTGDSDRLKDAFSLNWGDGHTTWEDLRGAIRYLKAQGAGDHEVTCWHFSAIPVYTELGIEPSNRFVFPGTRMIYFPTYKDLMREETMNSPQRFVVLDLMPANGPTFNFHQHLAFGPGAFPAFKPRSVWHSGRYVVLELAPRADHDTKTE